MKFCNSNENKKQLCLIYNKISKELFEAGTIQLKVDILDDDLILFRSKHRRAIRSKVLASEAPALQIEIDTTMSKIFKRRIKVALENEMSLPIETVLRDYDPETHWTITNIIIRK